MSKNVTVCVPTLNEEESIGKVVSDILSAGYDNILVIDGGSEDATRQEAQKAGANVHIQEFDGGKGAAMREAFEITDSEILVFIDGDDTYEPDDIDKLVKPIQNGEYEHVIGNRFANMDDGAMKLSHKIGNRTINQVFRLVFRDRLIDILSGFRAISREAYESMDIQSSGFDIETELCAKSIRNDIDVLVIPTSYYQRKGNSNLQGFSDGILIIKRIISSYRD